SEKVLKDPKICQYYLVCLPEELPVKETEELYEQLHSKYGISANIILNKAVEVAIPAADFKAAEKSASVEFQKFASEQKVLQNSQSELKKRLEQLGGKVLVLPEVWDHDEKVVLEQLAARIP
ncbi:MAG: hypothetical protein EOP04_28045, partial [Proteobacteria bacterium]